MQPRGPRLHPKGRENDMTLNIGISESNRDSIVKILNAVLADEYVLYTKTRNYHWNVVGPQFNDLHKFFEAQYETLNEVVDDVAERARSLGGKAFGTLAEFAQHTRLKEQPGKQPPALTMVATASPIDATVAIAALRMVVCTSPPRCSFPMSVSPCSWAVL